VLDTLEEKFGAFGCDSGNVKVQWNNIKNVCWILSVIWLGKSRRGKKTQEMISKMDERRKWKNVNTEEGRKNYRRLRTELKRATGNAKIECLENTCNEIMEFQRTGLYDLMYMKTKELGRKDTQGI
jgi:hypothetical protein